ncbi:aminotransferase class I/II-fold pyridoxal phosphate-dependent enzyme [Alkalibacterium sp. 20]|uniref:aminotransferase class I/II-fold pyridoxal phosphate-dependent enzyme n=1 Tax=Alkalibacterium sp. 20 TaxID=1798803 RepID=UPI0008FFFA7E|nr:aminotransferase class I/II-fold pyridoxal phosphate-dependent enzyme [Alkalibacterium sp. 20]OJF96497.1 aromatic amino acid aminotransferase [Alkalibacterium sp. 20]
MTNTHTYNLNREIKALDVSKIRQFDDQVSAFEPLIRLTLGQPDFPTPQHVKDAAKRAIDSNFSFYTSTAGDIKLREAASKFVEAKYNLKYNPQTEVIATVGATEALATSLFTILNPGDYVLIPSPFFSLYDSLVRMSQATPVYMDTSETDFLITSDMIDKTIQSLDKIPKAIILNYPNNPTGVTWTKEDVITLAQTLSNYPDMLAISDEIYSELVYDQTHISLGEHLRSQTIVINGLSKSHAMTGWRLGLIFAPESLTTELLKTHQALVTSASSITQYAGIEALTHGIDDALPMKQAYKKRRDTVVHALRTLDLDTTEPTGAFYVFASLPENLSMTSYDFCYEFAKKFKVAMIPGDAFGDAGEGYFRISYASSLEDIETAMDRLTQYVNDLRRQ